MAPSLKKSVRVTFFIVLIICMAGSALLVIQTILPGLIESKLLPELSGRMGIPNLDCRISRIGFSGADLGPITAGPSGAPTISIDTLRVKYGLFELFNGRVQNVRLSGVRINCDLHNGGVSFPGLDFKSMGGREQPASVTDNGTRVFPAQHIQIRSAVMVLTWQGTRYRIPFELDLRPEEDSPGKIQGLLRLYPRGQTIDLAINADVGNKKRAAFTLQGKEIDLGRFADISRRIPGLGLNGTVDIKANADIAVSPFLINALDAGVIWENGSATLPNLKIVPRSPSDNAPAHLKIQLNKKNKSKWHLSADHFFIVSPVPIKLSDISFSLDTRGKRYTAAGHFRSEFTNDSGPVTLAAPVKTRWDVLADVEEKGNWSAQIANTVLPSSGICSLKTGKTSLSTALPLLTISGAGTRHSGDATWQLSLKDLALKNPDAALECPALQIKGRIAFNQTGGENRLTATANADMSQTRISSQKIQNRTRQTQKYQIHLPLLYVSGGIQKKGSGKPQLTGMLEFSKATLDFTEPNIRLQGITGKIPFEWPAAKSERNGSFSISDIFYRDQALGTLKGSVRQKKTGAVFSMVHNNSLLPGLKLFASGRWHLEPEKDRPFLEIDVSVPDWHPATGLDLTKILPGTEGIVAGGHLSAKGKLLVASSGLTGSAALALKQGFVQIDTQKMIMDGIDMALSFPELPSVRSDAGQSFEFKQAVLGDITVNHGKIAFQIEPGNTLLIEKGTFAWCDGNIDAQSLRISPGTSNYRFILYCDRLQIARLLEQLSAVTAEGTGTVNGRIPLEYENGNLHFGDGFLYSTPGDGGRIKLSNTDMLTAGLPVDTPQFAQLDLAREALKDYEYTWAKLGLNSRGQTLFLRLQFDGKPMATLPFIYKKELGRFARVDAKSKGSLFQGISLDVNMQLPLNQILRYKDSARMFE
jgi:hypothetical protein